MDPLVLAFCSLIVATIAGVLEFLTGSIKRVIIATVSVFAVTFIIGFLFLVMGVPQLVHWSHVIPYFLGIGVILSLAGILTTAVGESDWEDRSSGISLNVLLGIVVVVGSLVAGFSAETQNPHEWFWGTCGDQAQFDELASYASVDLTHGHASHDLDPNELLEVTPDMALAKVKSMIEGESEGFFETNEATFQTINGHPWAIVSIKPVNYTAFQRKGGVVPHFYRVDAMDKDAQPEPMQANIRFVPNLRETGGLFTGAPFTEFDLNRHVQTRLNSLGLIGLDIGTLEIDENWQPFYTITTAKYTVGTKGYIVNGLIIVDPTTGVLSQHYPITSSRGENNRLIYNVDAVPQWVNNIFPSSLMVYYLNWWGMYKNYVACQLQASGRYNVETSEDVFSEGLREYQFTMAVITSDTSMSHELYGNPRTGEIIGYDVGGKQPALLSIKTNITNVIQRNYGGVELNVEESEIQYMLGEKVVYSILTTSKTHTFAGISLVRVSQAGDTTKYIVADSIEDAYSQLRKQITQDYQGEGVIISETTNLKQLIGSILRVGVYDAGDGVQRLSVLVRVTESSDAELVGKNIHIVADLDPFNTLLRDGETVTVTFIDIDFSDLNDVVSIESELTRQLATPTP